MVTLTKRPFIITAIERQTANVKVFTLKPVTPEVIEFTSGMFVSLTLKHEGKTVGPRSYSISGNPLVKDSIELTIQKVGEFTTALFRLEVGAEVSVLGPMGRFQLQTPLAPHVVLMSGGTGIAPMMSMLRYIQDSGSTSHVTFITSCRTQADQLHKLELRRRSDKFDNFAFIQTLTREPEETDWQGHRGRISEDMIKRHVKEYKDAQYYLCGPEPFVVALESILLDLEVVPQNIFKEQWG